MGLWTLLHNGAAYWPRMALPRPFGISSPCRRHNIYKETGCGVRQLQMQWGNPSILSLFYHINPYMSNMQSFVVVQPALEFEDADEITCDLNQTRDRACGSPMKSVSIHKRRWNPTLPSLFTADVEVCQKPWNLMHFSSQNNSTASQHT